MASATPQSTYDPCCTPCPCPCSSQVLLKLIQPYTRVRLPFISHALHIPEGDVERLLVSLILDNRIEGYVDQVRPGTSCHLVSMVQATCAACISNSLHNTLGM